MSLQEIIAPLTGILIAIALICYGVYIRAYLQGFKDGLDMGKRIGKFDAQTESEE